MIETPKIAETTDQKIACLALVVPRAEIQRVMGPALREVYAALKVQGIDPSGPWFTHHRQRPGETFDFRVCVPVSEPITASGRVEPGLRPACQVARTIYSGPYEGLGTAWSQLGDWIQAQGQTPREDLWECYLVGPESGSDATGWRTELNQPLTAGSAPKA